MIQFSYSMSDLHRHSPRPLYWMYVQIFMTLYEGHDRHMRDFKNNIKKELFLLAIKKDARTSVFSFVLKYFFQ